MYHNGTKVLGLYKVSGGLERKSGGMDACLVCVVVICD